MINEVGAECRALSGGALTNENRLSPIRLVYPFVESKCRDKIRQVHDGVQQTRGQRIKNRFVGGIDRAARTEMHARRNRNPLFSYLERQKIFSRNASLDPDGMNGRSR